MKTTNILDKLKKIAKKAYAPYSNFHVASILELNDGSLHEGFNIENVAYPDCMCAERVALYSLINSGKKASNIKCIYIYSPNSSKPLAPCGSCRQVLSEWIKKDTIIMMFDNKGKYIEAKFCDVFPYYVNNIDLKKGKK